MAKADPALVQRVIDAALTVIADPELRAKLVPDAIDDVDTTHLEMRVSVFETMAQMQKILLGAHAALAERSPAPMTDARTALVTAARAAAERYTPDQASIDALFAVASGLPDDKLVSLTSELEKLQEAQRLDLEVLLRMDDRAEAKAAKAAAPERPIASTPAERLARMQQMKADLEEKNRQMRARLEAMRK